MSAPAHSRRTRLAARHAGLLLMSLVCGCRGDTHPLSSLAVRWRIELARPAPVAAPTAPPHAGQPNTPVLRDGSAVFVDTSAPMAGFLCPVDNDACQSVLAAVLRGLPTRLFHEGGSRHAPEWHTVAESVRPSAPLHRPRREQFVGSGSRQDLALASMATHVAQGRWRVAVLVTDLVSTAPLGGAMGLAPALRGLVSADAARAGRWHVGLLGIRGRYWGVPRPTARAPRRTYSRYSEDAQRWLPLEGLATVPLYLLVVGVEADSVDAVGAAIAREVSSAIPAVATHWELLTCAAIPPPTPVRCSLGPDSQKGPQHVLVQDATGRARCVQRKRVVLSCPAPLAGASVTGGGASWPHVSWRARDSGSITYVLDCAALKRAWPSTPLTLSADLALVAPATEPWAAWSTRGDADDKSLGRTARLADLLAAVRPRDCRYRAVSEALFEP